MIYKEDIVNPYTGGKRLYVMNRTRSYMKNSSASITGSLGVDCVVIDDYMTDLKEIDTNEVVYCVNQESKGWLLDLYLKMCIHI